MSDIEQRRIRGERAKQLMDDPLVKDAFAALDAHLESQAAACDPDNAEKARRIIIAKQLRIALEREFWRAVEDGEVAVKMKELQPKRKMFRR